MQRSRSRGAYYPAMVAHVTLRFDEAISLVKPGDSGQPSLEPLVVPGGDGLVYALNLVPLRASVELAGIRQAWTFNLEFNFRDLPIDPRLLSAAAVELHLGTVPAEDFASGMSRHAYLAGRASKLRTRTDGGDPNEETLLFYGTCDTWAVRHGEDGSRVTLEGRDLRGMMLDGEVNMKLLADVDLKQDIVDVVASIIALVPGELGLDIMVMTIPDEWPGGVVPSPGTSDGMTRVRSGSGGDGGGGGGGKGGGSVSYWDIIVQYCYLVGAIPTFSGRDIWVRPAKDVFQQLVDPSSIPFKGMRERAVTYAGGEDDGVVDLDVAPEYLHVRRLVYGRDVKEVGFERKYGGIKVPIVEVCAVDDRARGAGKFMLAQWPPKDSDLAKAKGENKIRIPPPHGVRDMAQLTEIARNAYEEIGRGEVGGSCTTKHLASFGGDNEDPDLLRLRPGQAVEFAVDSRPLASRAPLVAELADQERRSFDEQVEHVRKRLGEAEGVPLGDATLARAIVSSARGNVAEALQYFRTATVRYDFDADSGVQVAFDFQNYIVSRNKAEGTQDPAKAGAGGKGTRARGKRARKAAARSMETYRKPLLYRAAGAARRAVSAAPGLLEKLLTAGMSREEAEKTVERMRVESHSYGAVQEYGTHWVKGYGPGK